jgi:hypothetical protein
LSESARTIAENHSPSVTDVLYSASCLHVN